MNGILNHKKIVPVLLAMLLTACGGHRLPAKDPVSLGIVPFASDKMTRIPDELNQRLFRSLHQSGRFRIIPVQENSQLLILDEMANFDMPQIQTTADSSEADSTAGADISSNNLPRWILTGVFLREVERTAKGSVVPFMLYAPSRKIVAELEFRLYDTQEKRWVDIRRVLTQKKRRGNLQVIDYDPSDPSLAVMATERQEMRSALYDDLFTQLINSVEKMIYADK